MLKTTVDAGSAHTEEHIQWKWGKVRVYIDKAGKGGKGVGMGKPWMTHDGAGDGGI